MNIYAPEASKTSVKKPRKSVSKGAIESGKKFTDEKQVVKTQSLAVKNEAKICKVSKTVDQKPKVSSS